MLYGGFSALVQNEYFRVLSPCVNSLPPVFKQWGPLNGWEVNPSFPVFAQTTANTRSNDFLGTTFDSFYILMGWFFSGLLTPSFL